LDNHREYIEKAIKPLAKVKYKDMNFTIVVSKVNLIINPDHYWVDTSTTRLTSIEKRMFFTYQNIDNEYLYIRISSTSKVLASRRLY